MRFEQKLKSLMGSKGISPSVLASSLGVTRQTVHNWLNGAQPKEEVLIKLCEFFQVTPATLVYGEGENSTQSSLQIIIEAVENALSKDEISISPARKAALISALMRITLKSGSMPDDIIIQEMAKLT